MKRLMGTSNRAIVDILIDLAHNEFESGLHCDTGYMTQICYHKLFRNGAVEMIETLFESCFGLFFG